MAFMQRQIVCDTWYEIETSNGTTFVPEDVIGVITYCGKSLEKGVIYKCTVNIDEQLRDYTEGEVYSVQLRDGFGARLSAPGYMDQTDWSVFDTEQEAIEYMDEYYPDDEDSES